MLYWLFFSLLISFVDLSYVLNTTTAHFAHYQALLVESLFKKYDNLVLPVNTLNRPSDKMSDRFNILIELWAFQLLRINEPERKFDSVVEYVMYWNDFRLRWNPEEFGGIDNLYLHRSKVWVPELTPMNVISSTDVRESYQHLVWIQNNGTIAFVVPLTISSICQYDVSSFPFDLQKCGISFAIRTMFQHHYSLKAYIHSQFAYTNLGNGEWNVLSVRMKETVRMNDSIDDASSSARITIIIERIPTSYILSFMVPTLVISSISTVGIFLKGTEILSRVSVGLSNVMSMSILLGVLNSMLPKTDVFPLLGVYFLLQFLMISSSLLTVLFFKNKKLYSTRRLFTNLETYQMFNVAFQALNVGVFISCCTWVPQLLQRRF